MLKLFGEAHACGMTGSIIGSVLGWCLAPLAVSAIGLEDLGWNFWIAGFFSQLFAVFVFYGVWLLVLTRRKK